MKIDKEKVEKILKSKKGMKKIMVATIMLAVCFYGLAMGLGHFGISFGTDTLMQWGNIFIGIAVVLYAYQMIAFDEELMNKMNSKKKPKDKPNPTQDNKPEKKAISGHIHGCGHPVRPVIISDDYFSIIESGYLDWKDEHDQAKNGECICFFCWQDKHKETFFDE